MRVTLVACALAVLACGREPLDLGPTGSAGMGAAGGSGAAGSSGRVPSMHRPVATACPTFPPPAMSVCPFVGEGVPVSCTSAADCTAGKDGLCVAHVPFAACDCIYDGCFADADCPMGQVCACSGAYSGNACVAGNCRVDADCGAGGFCSPVIEQCSGSIAGYQCHRPTDECVTDDDCPENTCQFDTTTHRWACRSPVACPL